MNPTEMQQKAIDTRDSNILVSAGAGSGKTTVLTKRLIERIKNGDSVRDFLVVTFMKAAASDVKRKLYDALMAESARQPDNRHLVHETLLISEADICTISSYCLSLVKENFALLGISPRVRIVDETESAMLLRRSADELIAEGYEKEDKSFLLLADNFSGMKNDEPLRELMISLYSSLRVMLDRKSLLRDCAETLRKDAVTVTEKGLFSCSIATGLQSRLSAFCDELLTDASDLYAFAASVATDDKYLAPLEKFLSNAELMAEAARKDYVNLCAVADTVLQTVMLSSKGCEPEYRDIIKDRKKKIFDAQKNLINRYCRGSETLIAESLLRTADIVDATDSFIDLLESRYESKKREMSALDYGDFEQKALELLETVDKDGNRAPTELCLKKQSLFKEILIDEYQDVNPMQDRIFTLLSNGKNRFMVGDVKQSIYRFRNAYTDIFLSYKDLYGHDNAVSDFDSTDEGTRILLRDNFRCSQNVIDYVNHVFDSVTVGSQYRKEYENEWLRHGSIAPERAHPVVVAVSDKERGNAEEGRRSEAEYVATEILRLVSDETSDDGTPLTFSNIAVMMSAMKGYSIEYEKAFRKYGIPYRTETSENFLENPDIRLAISALKAVDDPTDDISLCALMRSPICRFDSNDLYRIRTRLSGTAFWRAVCEMACPERSSVKHKKYRLSSHRYGEKCLAVRAHDFVLRINTWRRESTGVSCCDFLKSFFVSSGLLRVATSSGSRASLLLLFDYSRKYESTTNYGLSGFIDYISELSRSGRQIADAVSSGDGDAVSFMTVHKSKGLEFKVCFVAGADKQFTGLKSSSEITVLRRKGIFFRLRNRDELTSYDPLCNILAADEERDALFGEELRKLYVALTRAKERLYITGCMDAGWESKRLSPLSCRSWLELLVYVSTLGERDFATLKRILPTDGESGFIPPDRKSVVTPTEEHLSYVEYEYPHANSVTAAKKISVSELREGLLEDDEYNRRVLHVPESRVSMKPDFMSEKSTSASDIGTANHLFMQFCDFENVEKNGVSAESDRLLENRMLTTAQHKLIDEKSLTRFFDSDLYKRMTGSKKLYREKRFSVSDRLGESSDPILVQGVIDCFFENPDGTYTVVDYKTDRVKTASELVDRHRVQLDCYRRAVERMTLSEVSKTVVYSFALGREVEVE